jgi:hypothetical protein
MQEFQPLGIDSDIHAADAGDIAARPIEAGNKAKHHRIGADAGEDNWNRCGRRFRGKRRGRRPRKYRRDWPRNQIAGESWQSIVPPLGPSIFDRHIAAFDAARLSVIASADRGCRNPITGTVACCARAASGQTAAPLTRDMSSRRLIIR